MAQIQSGASADLLTVDPTFKAARVSLRPPEVTGAYRLSMRTGNTAAATAAGILAAFRYAGTGVAIVQSVRIALHVVTAYTQGSIAYSLWNTRSYTVIEPTGATAATLTGNNAKLRTSMATTSALFSIATTGTMTGGTGTDDAIGMAGVCFDLPNAVRGQPAQDLFNINLSSYPLVFSQNEGFRIRNDTAYAAAGVSNLQVTIEWAEATSY